MDNVHVDRGYETTINITLTTGDLTGTGPLAADYLDWMVKVQRVEKNSSLLVTTLVKSSPYIFMEKKKNQTPSYFLINNSQDVKLMSQMPVSVC